MLQIDSEPSSQAEISFFAETNYRNGRVPFGIKQADRHSHMYLIGKTGTGKSTLMETLILQDLAAGRGVALLDPHGDLVEKILARVPERRKTELIYFNVPDREHPLGFNPLEPVSLAKRSLAAAGLLEVFKKNWSDSWGPRLEHILRNALLVLFDQPQATLADVLKLLHDRSFRRAVAQQSTNTQVQEFWLKEFETYPVRFRLEAIAPIQNKVGAFLSDPVLSSILNQSRSAFKLRQVMDEGKILLVNLSKGQLGEDTASLLGSLLVSRIGLAALSRADAPPAERRDFFIYLDEFHIFTTFSLMTMLSELRKYHTGLVLANQYLAQLDPRVKEAILGNASTFISFRVGLTDAEVIAKEFYPEVALHDLLSLPNYHIYLKLMIDGAVSTPFSARAMQFEKAVERTEMNISSEPQETHNVVGEVNNGKVN